MLIKLPPASNLRRFSFGGYESDLADVAVWKFDVLLQRRGSNDARVTIYVNCASRGYAFKLLFGRWPGARIFGTGMPLTYEAAESELGRSMKLDEVALVDELGEFCS